MDFFEKFIFKFPFLFVLFSPFIVLFGCWKILKESWNDFAKDFFEG